MDAFICGEVVGVLVLYLVLGVLTLNDTTNVQVPGFKKRPPRNSAVAVRWVKTTLKEWLDLGIASDIHKALDQMGVPR